MTEFFGAVLEFLTSIATLVENFIAGIGQMLVMIPKALTFLTRVFNMMPPVLSVFAIAFVSVSVVYMVIDR